MIEIDAGSLRPLLESSRWFGHKDKALERVDVLDAAVADEGEPSLVLALIETHFADGTSAVYNVPLVMSSSGEVGDAMHHAHRLGALGHLMAHGDVVKGSNGVFEFTGAGLDPMAPPGNESVRVIGSEQSNTSLVLDEKIVVKLFRKLEAGPNPDIELNRVLTTEGYVHTPAQVGEITYSGTLDSGDAYFDIAIAQVLASDGTDGWEHVVAGVRGLYEHALGAESPNIPDAAREHSESLLLAITELGEATAEMHVVLCRDENDPAFAPEALEQDDLRALVRSARRRLTTLARDVEPLSALAPKLKDRLEAALELEERGSKTRVHGDFHLGQVLSTPRGWMLLDFEGEPIRSMEERRSKHSPLKDVAGMLRSFGYATTAALFHVCEPGSDEWARLEPWADAWETHAREAFIQAYLSRSHERNLLPHDRIQLFGLLELFELDKALYELDYERRHRPDWARIPLRGLGRIAAEAAV